MKPIFSLTPISDHAKELLAKIDAGKEDIVVYADDPSIIGAYTDREPENRNNKHDTFGRLYGEKHKHEPAYTPGQVKGLEAMYGHNRQRILDKEDANNSKVKPENVGHYNNVYGDKIYNGVSLILTDENLHKFDKALLVDCIIQADDQKFVDKLMSMGCRFRNCRVHSFKNNESMSYTLHKE